GHLVCLCQLFPSFIAAGAAAIQPGPRLDACPEWKAAAWDQRSIEQGSCILLNALKDVVPRPFDSERVSRRPPQRTAGGDSRQAVTECREQWANWVIFRIGGSSVAQECDDVKSLRKAKKPFVPSGRP